MIMQNFIVFEGIDGAGTSTQIKILSEKIQPAKLFVTAEPTELPTGKFIRKMLKGDFSVSEKTAAYLFASDRCEHIYGKGGIIENLEKGKIVVSDRYFFSSIAYQSIFAGEELPKKLNSDFPLPEFLFFFEISSANAFERVTLRGEEKEIYEKLDFQQKVATNYGKIISEYKNASDMKLITIDANLPIEEISKKIWEVVGNLPILKA